MKQSTIVGSVVIILAAMLWAIDGVALTPQLYTLPVPLVVLLEHALAFIIMLPFFLSEAAELKKLKAGDWGAVAWVAIFGGALGTMFITKALFYVNFINLSVVVLIQKLQPVFALLLAAAVLRERLPNQFFRWAILAIIATYFVTFDHFLPNLSTGDKTITAALYALGAAFAFGSSTVFSKRALRQINFRMGTYLRFGLTTLIMLVIAATAGSFSALAQVTPWQWLVFAIIVFTSGGSAMFLYYYGLKRVTASVSTICELAFPITSILLAALMYHQYLTVVQWLAALVLFYAIYRVSLLQQQLASA